MLFALRHAEGSQKVFESYSAGPLPADGDGSLAEPHVLHQEVGIPTVLVNGRLSEKSFKQGQKAGSLIKDAFGRLTMALAQYEEDAERLKAAGAHDVKVLGNLKFDFTPNAIQLRTGREILKYAERDIIGLASSREGEEQKFLEALKKAQAAGVLEDRLILIVPRHPQRFEEVAKLIEKSGFTYIKRSQIRDWKTVLSKQVLRLS